MAECLKAGFWCDACYKGQILLDGVWRGPPRKGVIIPTYTHKFAFVKQYGYDYYGCICLWPGSTTAALVELSSAVPSLQQMFLKQ